MNKRQIGQFNMLRLVETHFESNEIVWSSNVLISQTKAALSAKLNQISAAATLQIDDSVGTTMNKTRLRKDLEEKAIYISAAVCAYTTLNPGQTQLYQKVFITQSQLSKLREADLLLYVENLDEAAISVLENLLPYGINQGLLTEMMAARTAFHEIMDAPKEVTASRKQATETIAVLIHEAIALLKDTMDRLLRVLKSAYPDFVSIYTLDRRLHKIGTRSRSLEILTLDAANKSPLAEAKIEVIDHHIKRISSQKGKNRVQNLKEGNYILSVSHPDFVSQKISFTIISGQTTQIVIKMEGVSKKVAEFLSF